MANPPAPASPADSADTTDAAAQLRHRLDTTTATIGVVGLGYVGLPLAAEYAAQGFETRGIDLDEERVRRLNAGDNYIEDLDDEAIEGLVEMGRLRATAHYEDGDAVDVWFLCVPTPVTETNEPDPAYIKAATRSIAPHRRPHAGRGRVSGLQPPNASTPATTSTRPPTRRSWRAE
jgi:UDP-N-acetyl-D-mannosaminuronate dehydrogenase